MGYVTVARAPRPRTTPGDGRRRVVIEGIWPEIDAGRFPIKRVVGEDVWVEADVFTDGHDEVACVLRYHHERDDWHEVPMERAGNDRWRARFTVTELGPYRYTVQGWVDRFGTWADGLRKKVDAGQDVALDLEIGAGLVRAAARRATGEAAARLRAATAELRTGTPEAPKTVAPRHHGDNNAQNEHQKIKAGCESESGRLPHAFPFWSSPNSTANRRPRAAIEHSQIA